MKQKWRPRVDAFWHRIFGTAPATADQVITSHRSHDLSDYPGIYAILRHQSVYVSAPSDLVTPIRRWNPTIATVSDPKWWRHHLPDWLILGPSIHAFAAAVPTTATRTVGLRIEQTTPDQLLGLRASVDLAEWSEGGFAGDDIELAWCATDDTGQTVAAANLTPFDGVPSDVGVLTNPMVRGCGAGTAIASVATTYAVKEFGIARWRALTTNSASLRIAERLGFEVDCLQIALRPPKA